MDSPEELPDLTADEERLLDMLVEYDRALTDGTLSPVETQRSADVTSEIADQLERGKHLLELLATIGDQRDDDEMPLGGAFAQVEATAPAASPDDLYSPLRSSPQAPQQLGRFVVLRELGVGGHGVVLLAFDPVLKRNVALKVPRSEDLVSASMRRRFLREARAAARLTHPNLVSVYEVGEVGSVGYIACAYCPGPSLATWLKDQGEPLPPRLAADLIAQLADAMQYAHGQGVLHRDIKPSNVLLEPLPAGSDVAPAADPTFPFVPKLVDFGLAKMDGIPGTDTLSGVAMGTPGYMAPEQVEGRLEEIGAATDVYGMGVVLYECLTGQRPFVGSSDADTMQRILTEEPTPPGRLRDRIGVDIEAICLKCLEKRPGQRYASARALADDLRRFLTGEPIRARRVTKLERLGRWARRNPGIATLSATVLLLLTALALGSTVAAVAMARLAARERMAAEAAHDAERLAQAEADRAAEFADRARTESESAQRVAKFLEGMFRSADPIGLEGFRFRTRVDRTTELTAAEVLRQGAERLNVDLADHPAVQARLMAALGSVYVTLGMLREAQPLLEESLRIREELCGEDSLETAESLHNLATLRFANFDFSETKRLLHRALAIRSELLGPSHPDTIRTKFNLAWLVVTNGQETQAEKVRARPLMEEVLEFHRHQGDSPTQYAFALLGLAMLRYDVDNKPFQAAVLMAEANRVLHENGDSDIAAGLTLMLRSYVQRQLGNGRVAVKSVEAAIERMRKAVGERHPMLIWPRYLLAEALIGGGDYAEALEVYRDTVRFCEQIYHNRHRAIGITKARMAEPLLLMNDLAQAESTLREALDIFRQEDTNLSNRVHCVQELLGVLDVSDRNAEAAELCQQELSFARGLADNPESRTYLVAVLRQTAQVDEALKSWAPAHAAIEEAIRLQEALCGSRDPLLEDMLWQEARFELALGDVDRHRATCRRLLDTFADDAAPEGLLNLVWTCVLAPDGVADPPRLVALAEKALARNRRTSAYHTVLAAALYRAGQYDQAIEQLRESMRLQKSDGGWADKLLMSMAQARSGNMDEANIWLGKVSQRPGSAATTAGAKVLARRAAVERDALESEARQLLEQGAVRN